MGLGVELKPRRRLRDINVFEVSFVDEAANGERFLVFKRSTGGGDIMEQVKEKPEAGDKGNSESRLAELSAMLPDESKAQGLVFKDGEEKIKEDMDTELSDRYIELQKEVDGLREMIEELRQGLPIRKGFQEFEKPRERKSQKEMTISRLKSREFRSKMTHVHSPSPTEWAKELMQDGRND